MSTVRQLVVAGVDVPIWAMIDISQRYETVTSTFRSRMRSGTLKQRTIWSGKLRTTITGSGVIPAGLGEIDYESSFSLWCVAHRSVQHATTGIQIPANRRTDAGSLPYGRALVGEKWISTDVASTVDNTINLVAVSGATQYQVCYFPKITVFASPPIEDKPQHGPVFGWSLVAEEV
jgi:hypothetical protein